MAILSEEKVRLRISTNPQLQQTLEEEIHVQTQTRRIPCFSDPYQCSGRKLSNSAVLAAGTSTDHALCAASRTTGLSFDVLWGPIGGSQKFETLVVD
jgi:hypothetical protein